MLDPCGQHSKISISTKSQVRIEAVARKMRKLEIETRLELKIEWKQKGMILWPFIGLKTEKKNSRFSPN